MRALRRGVPGQEQERGPQEGHQHDAAWRRCGSRRRTNWRFFLDLPDVDRHAVEHDPGQGRPAAPAALRVLRRLRRLRRDAVPQAPEPALRRPRRHRQRDRLLVHLRRQPAHHAVDRQSRRARPGVGQLAVRGQRGVRPRHAAGARQADRVRARAGHADRPALGELGPALLAADQSDRRGDRGAARARRRSSRPSSRR